MNHLSTIDLGYIRIKNQSYYAVLNINDESSFSNLKEIDVEKVKQVYCTLICQTLASATEEDANGIDITQSQTILITADKFTYLSSNSKTPIERALSQKALECWSQFNLFVSNPQLVSELQDRSVLLRKKMNEEVDQ